MNSDPIIDRLNSVFPLSECTIDQLNTIAFVCSELLQQRLIEERRQRRAAQRHKAA
jgi:hypothetical protein